MREYKKGRIIRLNLDLTSIEGIFKNRDANLLGHEEMQVASVLVPLLEKDGEIHILFEVRAQGMRRQPGEICFPGGGVEEQDKDEEETAIRETCEELGLSREQIKMVAPLDLYVAPLRSIIYPYVGVILEPEAMEPNTLEVGEIFTVPLRYLLTNEPKSHRIQMQFRPDESFPFHLIPRGRQYKFGEAQVSEYFYMYEGHVIWGLTARILTNFLNLVKSSNMFSLR